MLRFYNMGKLSKDLVRIFICTDIHFPQATVPAICIFSWMWRPRARYHSFISALTLHALVVGTYCLVSMAWSIIGK